ncbi:MAG: hypothetical protein V1899_07015 [Planctomycetota bacterium]
MTDYGTETTSCRNTQICRKNGWINYRRSVVAAAIVSFAGKRQYSDRWMSLGGIEVI